MANGLTHDAMLERVYTEMVGLDGQSGMVKEHRDMKIEIDGIQMNMMTKDDCGRIRKGAGDRKDKVLMRVKDALLIISTIIGILVATGVLSRR